jgi:hypothetical protein
MANGDTPWMAAMRRGAFEQAWQISDAYLQDCLAVGGHDTAAPRHLQNVWDGRPLIEKRVLVRCYHGLGDTVQFLRFLRPLRRIAAHVSLWVQPELLPLAASAKGVDCALPLHDGAPPGGYDRHIEIMELGHALRITPGDLPGPIPYIFPGEGRARTLGPHLNVGLVWTAGDWAPHRSMPTRSLAPLSSVSNVRLYSLQRGPARTEASEIPAHDLSTPAIGELTVRLRALDLLICVDTFVAHIAGAMGLPVWLLLHADADWRWMNEPGSTVWYPTMRLFRQRRLGDWSSVIADIAAELAELASLRRLSRHWIARQEQTKRCDVRPS